MGEFDEQRIPVERVGVRGLAYCLLAEGLKSLRPMAGWKAVHSLSVLRSVSISSDA